MTWTWFFNVVLGGLAAWVYVIAPEPVGYMIIACTILVIVCGTLEQRARKGK